MINVTDNLKHRNMVFISVLQLFDKVQIYLAGDQFLLHR